LSPLLDVCQVEPKQTGASIVVWVIGSTQMSEDAAGSKSFPATVIVTRSLSIRL
jgi:hypothetical protein